MSDLETLKAEHPEWKKWPHKCFEFCVALQELVQQHEAELAKAQETIAELKAKLAEVDEQLEKADWAVIALSAERPYNMEPSDHDACMDAFDAAQVRIEARKKGAEHGE